MKLLRPLSVSILVALAACGGGASRPAPAPTSGPSATDDPSCPVAVPGTSVTVEDTPTGAALVFVTTGDVGEVRRRAGALAQMHNDHHGKMGPLPIGTEPGGGGHAGHDMSGSAGGGHAGHDMAGHDMAGHDMSTHAGHAGGMIGVHSKAEAGDVEGGVRVAFTAAPADVATLQAELRRHAEHLSTGTCAMGSHP